MGSNNNTIRPNSKQTDYAALSALQRTHSMEGGAWSVTVLPENAAEFEQYKQVLRSAQQSILLVLWYVFKNDPVITEVKNILLEKLRAGIKVKIIFSNNDIQKDLLRATGTEEGEVDIDAFEKEMRRAGAEMVDYSQEVVLTRGTHRKALVVDRSVCITGSRNVHWIYHFPLTVPRTHAEICLLVRNGTRDVVGAMSDLLESNDSRAVPLAPRCDFVQSRPHVKLDVDGPRSIIQERYVQLISAATQTIDLVQWSFIPGADGENLPHALKSAVKRGVQVRLLTNGVKQTKTQAEAGAAAVNELLRVTGPNGNQAMIFVNDSEHVIHCKYGVFDGVRICLGSFNFDDYSYDKNAEAVLVIESAELAKNLTEHSEWLRNNMPCKAAVALSGWPLFKAQAFGCCSTAAVEVAF